MAFKMKNPLLAQTARLAGKGVETNNKNTPARANFTSPVRKDMLNPEIKIEPELNVDMLADDDRDRRKDQSSNNPDDINVLATADDDIYVTAEKLGTNLKSAGSNTNALIDVNLYNTSKFNAQIGSTTVDDYKEISADDFNAYIDDNGFSFKIATDGDIVKTQTKRGKTTYTDRIIVLDDNHVLRAIQDMNFAQELKEGNPKYSEGYNLLDEMQAIVPSGGDGHDYFNVIQLSETENKQGDIIQRQVITDNRTITYEYNDDGTIKDGYPKVSEGQDIQPTRDEIENAEYELGIRID